MGARIRARAVATVVLVALGGLGLGGCGTAAEDAPPAVQDAARSVPSDVGEATSGDRDLDGQADAGKALTPAQLCGFLKAESPKVVDLQPAEYAAATFGSALFAFYSEQGLLTDIDGAEIDALAAQGCPGSPRPSWSRSVPPASPTCSRADRPRSWWVDQGRTPVVGTSRARPPCPTYASVEQGFDDGRGAPAQPPWPAHSPVEQAGGRRRNHADPGGRGGARLPGWDRRRRCGSRGWPAGGSGPRCTPGCWRGSPTTSRPVDRQRVVLEGHEDDPGPSALGLRLLGSVHRLVLERRAGVLATYYPSVGGRWDPVTGPEAVLDLLRSDPDTVREWLDRPPQTNEVGRAAALVGGLLHLAPEERLPVRLVEIGASAGLNLLADRFDLLDDRGTATGDPASPVTLEPAWRGPAPSRGPA